ncbi:MAG: hypothetical protein IJ635_12420 [Bacteroidaceae bacterium]|nr:hypothetical protein [Bacteroidaceae bacterium]
MKTFIKHLGILTATFTLSLTATTAHAQSRNAWYGDQVMQGEYLTLNPELVSLFNTLDSIFPKHYLINEEPHCVGMWVDYSFKNLKEYRQYRPVIEKLIERLNQVPAYRSYTERLDSTGMEKYGITLTPKTDSYRQTDYAYLTVQPRRMNFHYFANINGMKMPWNRRQDVADAADELLAEYINRPDVKKETVIFDGTKTNYKFLSYHKPYDCTYRCSGTRYIVPNCTAADYDRLYRFIRSHALSESVTVASNEIRGQYEEISLGVNQATNRPLIVGAALKGTDLYLIRTEGDIGSQAWIPRAWAEDNPIYP